MNEDNRVSRKQKDRDRHRDTEIGRTPRGKPGVAVPRGLDSGRSLLRLVGAGPEVVMD